MADLKTLQTARLARLMSRTLLGSPAFLMLMTPQAAQAQASGRVVSACSGVSLPRSVVTGIMSPVITGITAPIETSVNGILNTPLLRGLLLPPLSTNATGLLTQAAAGDPITLQALASDGTVIGPADQCRVTSDSITLDTPAGVAIGGNQITGLGANGAPAFAGDIDAIAFGNNARAEIGATASLALGLNSRATAANSVALGAGSVAARGALPGYTALGLSGPQSSAGEVSIGAPGALRQLTNVAAGSAPSDAATVGQLDGVRAGLATLGTLAVQYDGNARDRITLAGAGGTTIGNVAPGTVAAGSTEAVNGAQLFATDQVVAANTGAIAGLDTRVVDNAAGIAVNGAAIAGLDTRVSANTSGIAALDATAVRYDAADRAAVTFGGPGGTVLGNVAPGALTATSLQAVNGAQLFATNQAVGTNTTAIVGLDTRVTDNSSAIVGLDGRVTANTTAITALDGRITSATDGLAALDAAAVRYDAGDRATVTFGGAAGTTLVNIAPGALTATSTQAVNGAQLFATNAQVAANTAAIAGLGNGSAGPVRYSTAAAPTVPNGGTISDDVTMVGAGGSTVGLHNVRDGAVAAGSADAVTGGQLFATNQAVAGLDGRVTNNANQIATLTTDVANNTTAITALQTSVNGTNTSITNLTTQVSANTDAITTLNTAVANQPLRYADAATPTTPNGGTVSDDATLAGAGGGTVGLHNVRAGALVAGSTDAVNGDQLAATNTQVAANSSAINTINTLIVGSTVSAVQYSNPGTPTTPNGGARTNDVTLVGADGTAPVALHNVAGGAVAAGSTDAVNGQQLFAVSTTASNSVQYDRDATGARTNTVTLAGGNAAAPVTLANVAAGVVAPGSTQAVNGGQLYATDQVARAAAALGANSVQYDAGATSVTFGNAGGMPITLRNVGAGTSTTDAVNVGQLQAGIQGAVAQANNYTDTRLNAALAGVDFDLRQVRRDLGAGTSAAMAAAALPQANEAGHTMVAIGGGTYRGQSAIAFGASTFLNDGHSILRIGATYDSRGYGGANAGFGYQF